MDTKISTQGVLRYTTQDYEKLHRIKSLQDIQCKYKTFVPFLSEIMHNLGFSLTKIQADIANFMAQGGRYIMIQAQRGQAKTTIAAAYSVYSLVHNPSTRILIVSAGNSQASDISTLIVRIIMNCDFLSPLRPDRTSGDRTSVEKFDIHHLLKGVDKSASVGCCGITSNMQGKRADLLIADDIESSKNSLTATMREQLLQKTLDFTSINPVGRIIYLGTPQSIESIYNSLPSRGYNVRIWTGRFPNKDQIDYYGDMLAPSIKDMVQKYPELQTGGGLDSCQGKPIDPNILSEQDLTLKELDQGQSWFQLQHMLNTKLLDADRYPLKTSKIIAANINLHDKLPVEIYRGTTQINFNVNNKKHFLADAIIPNKNSLEHKTSSILYVDPAGGGKNGDETGWCYAELLNSTIYILGCGGVAGGYDDNQLHALVQIAIKYNPQVIMFEKNFGYGAFKAIIQPMLLKELPTVGIQEEHVSGTKELRIIDTLEPIIARGSLVISYEVLNEDWNNIRKYPIQTAMSYSLLYQISSITRDKHSLIHDDKIDALAGACNYFKGLLSLDNKKEAEKLYVSKLKELMKDPLGHNECGPPRSFMLGNNNMLDYRRNLKRRY